MGVTFSSANIKFYHDSSTHSSHRIGFYRKTFYQLWIRVYEEIKKKVYSNLFPDC